MFVLAHQIKLNLCFNIKLSICNEMTALKLITVFTTRILLSSFVLTRKS